MIIILPKTDSGGSSSSFTGSELTLDQTDSATAPSSGKTVVYAGTDGIIRSKRSDGKTLELTYGIEHLLPTETLVIPERRQMVVATTPIVEGELVVEGTLAVVPGGSNHNHVVAQIPDFDYEVINNAAVLINSQKLTNRDADTTVVNTLADRNALSAIKGDIVVVTSETKTFRFNGTD